MAATQGIDMKTNSKRLPMSIAPQGEQEILITREFNAPRKLVWDAWTKPEIVQKWLGVFGGWSFKVCEMDVRAGGKYRWVWKGPGGEEMGMGGVYKEVSPVDRLVSVETFDVAWYPGDGTNTITLTEKNGRTLMTLVTRYESMLARDGVIKSPMEHGLRAGFDKLEDVLAEGAVS